MFGHNFVYALKAIFRERQTVFWACCFPFVLGALFYFSFGDVYERAEKYHEIPTAIVVEEKNQNHTYFQQILKQLEDEEGTKMFSVQKLSQKEAEKLLGDGEIDGYYLLGDEISLVLRENGVNQTILNMFLQQYERRAAMIFEMAKEDVKKLPVMLSALEEPIAAYRTVNESGGNMDDMVQYFYALIAMSCLFGSYLSIYRISKLQANTSAIGQRRGVAPTKKWVVITAEFSACFLIELVVQVLLLIYLELVFGINLGGRVAYMLPVMFVGSACGIALGILFGSLAKLSEDMRYALNLVVSLGLSFFSGLMINTIKQFLEDHAPVVNRLNPATLIVDALYALNVYDTFDRYLMDMGILTGITVVLCVLAVLMTRRVDYASL